MTAQAAPQAYHSLCDQMARPSLLGCAETGDETRDQSLLYDGFFTGEVSAIAATSESTRVAS